MTGSSVTLFVEGKTDKNFYSRIFSECNICESSLVTVRLAREIDPKLGTGKSALVAQFNHLRATNALAIKKGATTHTTLFFLDKDIDDIESKKLNSAHAIYTEYYCIENYFFLFGDLKDALCSGAGLDVFTVGSFPDNSEWTKAAAQNYKNWMALCLLMRELVPTMGPNYGTNKSEIQSKPYEPVNTSDEDNLLTQLASRASLIKTEVLIYYEARKTLVQEKINNNTANEIFNGKWYERFLTEDAIRYAGGEASGLQTNFPSRMESVLISSLNYTEPWAVILREKVKAAFPDAEAIEK